LSWLLLPSAITRPWSITAMRSASWSASSRYCVVSSTRGAAGDQRPDDLPDLVAAARVEPGGRFVEEDQVGVTTMLAAMSIRRRIPPE
jgi:hypothetical protein